MNDGFERQVTQLRAELVGRRVLLAQLGLGSIVLLDFAGPDNEVEGYVRVECAWSLRTRASVLAASEDERRTLARHLAELTGQVLSGLDVLHPTLELLLDFENGYRLHAFPVYVEERNYENWVIRTPNGRVLTAGPGGELQSSRADEA
jgi:hypothetical protein